MADQWSYRMFGQEFGPVPFDELKQLADSGAISSTDEVRAGDSSDWVSAGSIHELGLANDVVADAAVATTMLDGPDPDRSEPGRPSGADNWYCMFHGQELGPLGIEEIEAFAEQGQLAADDEVKLGANGKWRRVGSIGRLMAVLPYSATEKQIPTGKRSEATIPVTTESTSVTKRDDAGDTSPVVATVPAVPHVAPVVNTELIHAQAAYAAADHAAKVLVGWATAPTADPAWWGWVGGTEYGPVGFLQIFEWAVSGRLQSTDFVKNGVYGQYLPAASVPGLMAAAAMLKQAKETLKAEEAKAAAARTPAVAIASPAAPVPTASVTLPKVEPPKPAAPVQKSDPVIKAPTPKVAAEPVPEAKSTPADVPARPAVAESPAPRSFEPERPAPATPVRSSGSYNTMSSGSYGAMASAARPAPSRAKSSSKSSGSSGGAAISELLSSPVGKAGLGAAVVLLLILGWNFLPASKAKDIERYNNLKKILDDVREARAKKTDPSAIKPRAEKLTKEYTPILKVEASNEYPAKQSLLWAARDELPRMMAGNLMEESQAEKAFAAHLKDAASKLGIK